MREDFLHFLWKNKLFSVPDDLQTVQEEKIRILKYGHYNSNAGPDFLNAHIQLEHQIWVGNVEIHVKSSDWYAHNHEKDHNYDAVILHVVWEHDVEIFQQNNVTMPTLELQNRIAAPILYNYKKLFAKHKTWIPCEKYIKEVDDFTRINFLEKLYVERLERKTKFIEELLHKSNNNYEAVLFWLLAKNFGSKVNGAAFFSLAMSFDYRILQKLRSEENALCALLFGQSGLLQKNIDNPYFQHLKEEYMYIKHKFDLKELPENSLQFFRMRPNNFPTIRLAQLVALVHKHSSLFSTLMSTSTLEGFYRFFDVELSSFWKKHYTFTTESKNNPKKITTSFVDLVIVNTIIPMKFVYLKARNSYDEMEIFKIIAQIQPEKNSIINRFSGLKIKAKSALETQALLQLKTYYCDSKKCLQCRIGNNLVLKNSL